MKNEVLTHLPIELSVVKSPSIKSNKYVRKILIKLWWKLFRYMLKMLKYEMKIKDEFKDGVVSYLSNKND